MSVESAAVEEYTRNLQKIAEIKVAALASGEDPATIDAMATRANKAALAKLVERTTGSQPQEKTGAVDWGSTFENVVLGKKRARSQPAEAPQELREHEVGSPTTTRPLLRVSEPVSTVAPPFVEERPTQANAIAAEAPAVLKALGFTRTESAIATESAKFPHITSQTVLATDVTVFDGFLPKPTTPFATVFTSLAQPVLLCDVAAWARDTPTASRVCQHLRWMVSHYLPHPLREGALGHVAAIETDIYSPPPKLRNVESSVIAFYRHLYQNSKTFKESSDCKLLPPPMLQKIR